MLNEKKRIYLSTPHMGGMEQQFVDEAFKLNWIAPLGPNVDAFESELSDYVGTKGALALSSGTAAIHLALLLLGIGPGDKVFCSALTFVASANPILYQKAEPVFIDSEPESWNMSPVALERAFKAAELANTLPKAVIVVNLYGQSADMDRLLMLCNSYGVPLIEDASESLGATYKGKKSGTFGKLGIYSFNGNKIITTSGGGMLVGDDIQLLEKARFLATQAKDFARHYQHSEIGYNYRLSNVSAGVGRGQLRVLEEHIDARRLVFQRYCDGLSHVSGIKFMPEAAYGRSTRWLTALEIDPEICGIRVMELVDYLAEYNIESRPVWKPMHMQPLFKHCKYFSHGIDESISTQLFENGICLPSGSNLTVEEQNTVIGRIHKFFAQGFNS